MRIKLLFSIFILVSEPVFAQYNSVWDTVPDEIRNTNSFKRYEWFYRPRTDERGIYPKEHIEAEKLKELQKLETRDNTEGTSGTWTNIGPKAIDMTPSFIPYWGSVSGRVRGMDIHPTDPDILYIGAAAGGIWKTTDGGVNWTDVCGDLNLLTFGALEIDPNNPSTLFAGTGESIWAYNNVTYEGDGLYKSTDGGSNWTRITNGFGSQTQFSDIDVSPHNSNLVLAALGSGNWNNPFPSNEGIWRSTDAGSTWSRVYSSTDGFDVAFHPSNSSIAFAVTGDQRSTGGFLISTDAGATWTQSNSGLPAPTSIARMHFDVAQSDPNTIYALIYNNSAFPSGHNTVAYKSTNGGSNWSQISAGVNIAGSYNGTAVNDQGSYDLCIAVNPSNKNIVYFGNVELSRTANGSSISFVRYSGGYTGGTGAWDCPMHVDIHKIKFAPSDSDYIYVGCDGGIYRSSDGGSSWTHLNNDVNTIQFYRVASHPTNASILFGGAQDNGNFSTNNKGVTDWVFEASGDGMECFVDYNNPNYVFMSTQYGSLMRSTNGGSSWSTMLSGFSNTAWVAPYWQHPTGSNKIYAALSQRIARSTDSGGSWYWLSSTLTSNRITSVAHSKSNPNYLMAVASYYTTSPGVFISTNEGVSWSNITSNVTSAGFSGTNINRAVADPFNASAFYLCRASYSSGIVIKTTNLGVSWTDISSNLPGVPSNDLFVDPSNPTHLYLANDFGVYWSSNGGTNWQKLDDCMPFVPVLDFSFFDNGGTRYLRAATHGRGVYELNIDQSLPVELSAFAAGFIDGVIELKWTTQTETGNYGFEIERSTNGSGFGKIGFVTGSGNSNAPRNYDYRDKPSPGYIQYRLKQIDTDGSFGYSQTVGIEFQGKLDFRVSQNYPNPFNPVTIIKYDLPGEGNVKVDIYNLLGQKILRLIDEDQNAGSHEVIWNAESFSSGIYFYTLNFTVNGGSESHTQTRKMILAK